jgi:hypothetical protein
MFFHHYQAPGVALIPTSSVALVLLAVPAKHLRSSIPSFLSLLSLPEASSVSKTTLPLPVHVVEPSLSVSAASLAASVVSLVIASRFKSFEATLIPLGKIVALWPLVEGLFVSLPSSTLSARFPLRTRPGVLDVDHLAGDSLAVECGNGVVSLAQRPHLHEAQHSPVLQRPQHHVAHAPALFKHRSDFILSGLGEGQRYSRWHSRDEESLRRLDGAVLSAISVFGGRSTAAFVLHCYVMIIKNMLT